MPTFDKDPGPLVNASIWAMTAVGTVFLAARIYCKTIRTTNMWWDDYLLISGWVSPLEVRRIKAAKLFF